MIVSTLLLGLLAQSGSSEVTVYNGGFGLIKEVRPLTLLTGRHEITIDDVAATIESDSVSIRSLTRPEAFSVLEQNFRTNLITPGVLLDKSIGKVIRLHRVLADGRKEVVEGTLLSTPTQGNGLVVRTSDGRILLDPVGEIEIPTMPSDMLSRPALNWQIDSRATGAQDIELSYLAAGLSWNCDYVMTLGPDDKAALQGWITMSNRCGKSFRKVSLKLMAGEVNRVQAPGSPFDLGQMQNMAGFANPAPAVKEESLFEYHLYTVQRPVTIADKEQKQISLLAATSIPFEKKLVVDSMLNFGMYYPHEGDVGTGDIKPLAKIEFINKKENGLGIPLPKGNIKFYQRDQSGSLQMIGENAIDHTPKDERLSVVLGRSFDVRATRTRTDYRRLDDHSFLETFEIEVRNRKSVPERVYVYERHYSEWEVPKTNMKWDKLDSQTMQYVLDLKPGETQKVEYTIITHW